MQLKRAHACAIAVAVRLADSPKGEWMLARELCKAFPVRQAYVVDVLRQLIVAGLVARDTRDPAEYALARPAAKVTLLEILEAVEGPLNQPMPPEIAELPRGAAHVVEAAVASGVNELGRRLAAVTLADLRAAKAA